MDSQGIFCPNLDCPARGQSDQGTIRVHRQKDHRYRCTVCHRTFAATKGTPFYRLHAQRAVFVSVVTL
jgi:transposase-like protein